MAARAASIEQSSRETLWTLHQNTRRITAEVWRTAGEWELRLFGQGLLITWRRFSQRAQAIAYADFIQQDLEGDDWR
jgi:hypothetical protein